MLSRQIVLFMWSRVNDPELISIRKFMLKHFIIWNNCSKIEVACSIGVFLQKKMIW